MSFGSCTSEQTVYSESNVQTISAFYGNTKIRQSIEKSRRRNFMSSRRRKKQSTTNETSKDNDRRGNWEKVYLEELEKPSDAEIATILLLVGELVGWRQIRNGIPRCEESQQIRWQKLRHRERLSANRNVRALTNSLDATGSQHCGRSN